MSASLQATGTWALLGAILFVLTLLVYEWLRMVDSKKIETMSLAHIERSHPRMITVRETIITIILSMTLGILVAELAIVWW